MPLNDYKEALMERFYNLWQGMVECKELPLKWTSLMMDYLWWLGTCAGFKPDGFENENVAFFASWAANEFDNTFYPLAVEVINKFNRPGYPKGFHPVVEPYTKKGRVALCFALPSHLPIANLFEFYADKIVEVQKAIDQNLRQVVLPVAIPAYTDREPFLRELMKTLDDRQPFVAVNGEMGSVFNPQNLQGTYYIDKLIQYKKDWENELRNIVGIDSSSEEKRERLLTDEVNSNNAIINLARETIQAQFDQFSADLKALGITANFKVRQVEASSNNEPQKEGEKDEEIPNE